MRTKISFSFPFPLLKHVTVHCASRTSSVHLRNSTGSNLNRLRNSVTVFFKDLLRLIDLISDALALTWVEAAKNINRAAARGNHTGSVEATSGTTDAPGLEDQRLTAQVEAVRTPIRVGLAAASCGGVRAEQTGIVKILKFCLIARHAAAVTAGDVGKDTVGVDVEEGAGDEVVRSTI